MGLRTAVCVVLLCAAVTGVAQRLPEGVVPVHYTLSFTPDIHAAKFEAHEQVQVHLQKSLDAIILNAVDIEFHKVVVQSANRSQPARVSLDRENQTATLQLATPVPAGDAVLDIDYSGVLNDKLRGFYLVHGKDRNYASTQLEATDARRAFPSFDEPALKATFDISLTIDDGDTAISNGPIVSDTPGPGGGKHTLRFATTAKMSTYLVAMIVGDWKCVEGNSDGIPIRICATPDKVQLGQFALKATENILHSLDQYFGNPYPYKKLDVIAVPDFEAGAMENVGAITFREAYLLVDEQNSSVAARRTVAEILAHELVHMWFGDLVTMVWWDDLWLNEGFATWMVSKPVGEWKPDWKESLQDVRDTSNTLNVDSSAATRQIRMQATTPDEINELFDGIAYGKAAAVLHMIEQYVGPDVFRAGVKRYMEKYAYGNATAEDFWNTLAEVSNKPMARVMSSFVDQPGVPMLSVQSHCEGNKMTVEANQQRFYLQESLLGSPSNQVWTIPVCFRTGGSKDCRIMDRPQQEFEFQGCFPEFSADADGSGYYRTNYAADTLRNLPGSTWDARQRDRLTGDLWALVRAGKEDVGQYLDLLRRMGADRERVVLETEIQPLPTIANYLADADQRDSLSALIRDLVGPRVKQLGWQAAPNESDDDRQLRPVLINLLGAYGNDAETVQHARKLADQYLQDRSSLDPSVVPTVLGLAAKSGDSGLYERYVQAGHAAKSPEEVLNFLYGLTAFSDPGLVRRTLETAVSSEVRSQDSPYILVALLNNSQNRQQTWSWIKDHWEEVRSRFTMSSGSRVVAATGAFCDRKDREDVRDFFTNHEVESSERALAASLHNIDSCVEFREQQSSNLAAWLRSYTPKSKPSGGGIPAAYSPSAN